ncbi:MAG: PAS domain-containing protein, partial [Methanomassiliicoccales archaeon]
HLAVSAEMSPEKTIVGPGHPIFILIEEHKYVRDLVDEISRIIPSLENLKDSKDTMNRLRKLIGDLKEYNKHKIREENALFPVIEKHGVTKPPSVMWSEHDQQRDLIKRISNLVSQEITEPQDIDELKSMLKSLSGLINSHFYKEENILFPTAFKLIDSEEWVRIKESMDELGYCSFTPSHAIGEGGRKISTTEIRGTDILLETGTLSIKQLEGIMNSLPIDITFVDDHDTVRYFNQAPDRIFPRTKAIIGRKVQKCHPEKSVSIVERILNDFRNGSRDSAKFWIRMGQKYVYIQYIAVRDKNNEYLGCLEVTQDIAPIKAIEGEKRLLD